MKRLGWFLFFSILVHAGFQMGIFKLADVLPKPTGDELVLTEIEVVDDPEKAEPIKPIIKQLDAKNPILNDDLKARFDSEKTQRVQKETKANEIGLSKNASNQNSTKNKSAQNNNSQNSNNKNEVGELPEFTRMNLNPNSGSQGRSAISQILPNDIQVADATNLNTDANTYYSFYNRVEELFYVRWGERLSYYWERLSYEFKKTQLSGRVWSTTIEVWLTSTGEYHSSYIQRSSGYKPFDEAAVFAFKDARFFPNPPKSKIESDGFVRLKYRLSVHIN